MHWNGQGKNLDHLINKRWDPSRADSLQADFNGQRQSRIQKALQTRPVYIPMQFDLPAAGQSSPVRQTTDYLSYDVIITGIRSDSVKTDGSNRDIIIERSDNTRPILAIDYDASLYLRVDEIAGKTVNAGGGKPGVFYLPSPIVLAAGERLTVQVFKTDDTATNEIANIVFIGVAVYSKEYAATMLDSREQAKISELLNFRETPQQRFLKHSFDFDTPDFGGAARNLSTPANLDEPVLVRGLRTNLANSRITLNLLGQPQWTVNPTPIWAIGAEDDLQDDNYIWFSRPIYLRSNGSIQIPVISNGTGTDDVPGPLDPQTGNSLTWICETI